MTSFEIFDFCIHLLSWLMIFLTYALTWSSRETIMFRPYFFTLRSVSLRADFVGALEDVRCEVLGWVDSSLEENGIRREFEELDT